MPLTTGLTIESRFLLGLLCRPVSGVPRRFSARARFGSPTAGMICFVPGVIGGFGSVFASDVLWLLFLLRRGCHRLFCGWLFDDRRKLILTRNRLLRGCRRIF